MLSLASTILGHLKNVIRIEFPNFKQASGIVEGNGEKGEKEDKNLEIAFRILKDLPKV